MEKVECHLFCHYSARSEGCMRTAEANHVSAASSAQYNFILWDVKFTCSKQTIFLFLWLSKL